MPFVSTLFNIALPRSADDDDDVAVVIVARSCIIVIFIDAAIPGFISRRARIGDSSLVTLSFMKRFDRDIDDDDVDDDDDENKKRDVK